MKIQQSPTPFDVRASLMNKISKFRKNLLYSEKQKKAKLMRILNDDSIDYPIRLELAGIWLEHDDLMAWRMNAPTPLLLQQFIQDYYVAPDGTFMVDKYVQMFADAPQLSAVGIALFINRVGTEKSLVFLEALDDHWFTPNLFNRLFREWPQAQEEQAVFIGRLKESFVDENNEKVYDGLPTPWVISLISNN
jgi:hypothetical protein